jgi:endonuclease III
VTYDQLLQEKYADDSWRIFAVCILLTQTGRVLVDRVEEEVFARWPDAYAMREAGLRELALLLEGNGLGWVKAYRLIRMSEDWVRWYEKGDMLPGQITGVGRYGEDSYEIFYCGRRDHPVPSGDKELLAYVAAEREVAAWRFRGVPVVADDRLPPGALVAFQRDAE